MSGGEKTRIALAKLILRGANFLILDEPTNHLDLPAREAIETALKNFTGTILIVTHDRYLLDSVTSRVVEFVREEKILPEKIPAEKKSSPPKPEKISAQKKKPAVQIERLEAQIKMAEMELKMLETEINSTAEPEKLSELATAHENKLQEIDNLYSILLED